MDSSASACAASGLLELYQLVPESESEWYRKLAAKKIIAIPFEKSERS